MTISKDDAEKLKGSAKEYAETIAKDYGDTISSSNDRITAAMRSTYAYTLFWQPWIDFMTLLALQDRELQLYHAVKKANRPYEAMRMCGMKLLIPEDSFDLDKISLRIAKTAVQLTMRTMPYRLMSAMTSVFSHLIPSGVPSFAQKIRTIFQLREKDDQRKEEKPILEWNTQVRLSMAEQQILMHKSPETGHYKPIFSENKTPLFGLTYTNWREP